MTLGIRINETQENPCENMDSIQIILLKNWNLEIRVAKRKS